MAPDYDAAEPAKIVSLPPGTEPSLKLNELPAALHQLTFEKSGAYQSPDVPASTARENYWLTPAKVGERRIFLEPGS